MKMLRGFRSMGILRVGSKNAGYFISFIGVSFPGRQSKFGPAEVE